MVHDTSTKMTTCHYYILRREVCQQACFFLRHGDVHPPTKQRIMKRIHEGRSEWARQHKELLTPCVKKNGLKRDALVADLNAMAEMHGDQQLDVISLHPEMHLDPGITKGVTSLQLCDCAPLQLDHAGFICHQEHLPRCIEKNREPASHPCFMHI